MPDNRNTAEAPLDPDDWQIVFEPYAKFPILALVLAQHLTGLQDYVKLDSQKATAAINGAVDQLYQHSRVRSVSLQLFGFTVQGRPPVDVENVTNALGIWS